MAEAMVTGSIYGVDLTLQNLRRLVRPRPEALSRAAKYLSMKMRENVSLTDHSLAELAKMGHPYSKAAPQQIHTPDWLVHKHGGGLVGSIGSEVSASSSPSETLAQVGVDTSLCDYALYVIYGTSKMVGRDFVTGTFEQEYDTVGRLMMVGAQKQLTKEIRRSESLVARAAAMLGVAAVGVGLAAVSFVLAAPRRRPRREREGEESDDF